MRNIFFLAALLSGSSVAAAGCPPAKDYSEDIAAVIGELQQAPDAATAQELSGQLWGMWLDAPDEVAQSMLDDGMRRQQSFDFLGARLAMDDLVAYCPDYAEGYNQRAFASFLAGDFEAALSDIEITLGFMPVHLGALTGKALTLLEMGRYDEAQTVLRFAVSLNPWLAERALLAPPQGTDI